jgi:hypothetical protein
MKNEELFDKDLTESVRIARSMRLPEFLPSEPEASTRNQRAECRAEIERAILWHRLQAQYEVTGLLPLPIDDYLCKLARLAGVELSPRRRDASQSVEARLSPWILLARTIGIATEHLRTSVRVWFAVEFGGATSAGEVMARDDGSNRAWSQSARRLPIESTSISSIEVYLTRLESAYTSAQQRQLNTFLRDLV